jgi:periplasmic protein CpxP/Spy
MSLYSKLKGISLGLVIALACGAGTAFAQQTGTAQQEDSPARMQREGRGERRGKRDHKLMGMMRVLRELNLTDAQQSQARAIFERFSESIRPQREALEQLRGQHEQGTPSEETRARAKQLRGEIREAMQRARAEVVAILTPEQRTKLEQMEMERKARHDERRARRHSQQDNEQ